MSFGDSFNNLGSEKKLIGLKIFKNFDDFCNKNENEILFLIKCYWS